VISMKNDWNRILRLTIKELGMKERNERQLGVTTTTADRPRETGPWDTALAQLQKWDPEWAKTCLTTTTNPWDRWSSIQKVCGLV
jgi:hypothetical protein